MDRHVLPLVERASYLALDVVGGEIEAEPELTDDHGDLVVE